jgi:glycosyltransferase involved in cell wall biosynthesis
MNHVRGAKRATELRVLVASHSHPKISHGGAEIAAYRVFNDLKTQPNIRAWFLGCDPYPGGGRDGIAITQPFGPDEYLYSVNGQFDWFRFANRDPRFPDEFAALLRELQPHVVHLHHYVNFGVEALLTIRRTLPDARIIMTLHEYQAICNHFGQMVKRGHFSLCDQATHNDCHKCFPEIDRADFFMRERYVKLFFDYVDHFVSPSSFLAQRYVDWGVDARRISVIENITAPSALPDEAGPATAEKDAPLRIGFFGQISKLKGIGVLLDCAEALANQDDAKISINIFGDYRGQPKAFQDEFLAQLARVTRNVNYRGPYRQTEVDRLMRSMDAVVVPSIWWENSPVVIQEALRNNRPVLCSDVGGMAEKVRDGLDGLHFSVGSGLELSYLLLRLHEDRAILHRLRGTMRRPPSAEESMVQYRKLYAERTKMPAVQ